ncbi:MAG: hypothetical protein ACYC6G_11900 [Desulfobaccales bacterium]
MPAGMPVPASAPFTLASGNINANVANQTLHITGDATLNVQRGLGGGSTNFASGALLSIEGGTINGGNGGNGIDNYNLTNLRGNFNGVTLYADASYNLANFGGWNYYNLTGDSTWNNGALNIMNFNGYKLDVTGAVTNFASVDKGVNVGTGTLNNPGAAATTISNGNTMTFAGGSITGATGSAGFKFATNLRGWENISTPVEIDANGSLAVSGGTTTITAPLNNIGGATVGIASGAAIHLTGTTANWGNFSNSGALISDPSTQTFNNLTVNSTGNIQAAAGDVYKVQGNFTNNSTGNTHWNTTQAILNFIAPGTSNAHTFALAGVDLGQNFSGYTDNFAWGTLSLDPSQTLTLTDGNATLGAALYVDKVAGLDIDFVNKIVNDITGNGFNIYYNLADNPDLQGLIYSLGSGGFLAPVPASAVPVPPSLLLMGSGLLGLGLLGRKRAQQS